MDTITESKGLAETLGGMFACFSFLVLSALFLFSLVMALTRKSKGWIAGAVVTGLLSLLLVALAIVFGIRAGAESVRELSQSRDFVTGDGLATITGGPGWRELDLGSEAASLTIGNEIAGDYLLVISESKSEFEPDFSIREFAELASEQVIDSVEGAESTELLETVIQGKPAYEQELSGSIEGVGLFYLNTHIEGEDHFHQVMTWTLIGRRDKALGDMRAAAASFREVEREMP